MSLHLPMSFHNVCILIQELLPKPQTGQSKITQITQSPKQLLAGIGWNNEEQQMGSEKTQQVTIASKGSVTPSIPWPLLGAI